MPFIGAGISFLVGSLIGGLMHALGTFVGRVLLGLGFGLVVYSGFDMLLDWARDEALAAVNGTTGNLLIVLYALKVPAIINLWFSAWTASLAIMGMTGGTFQRLAQRGAGSGT